MQVSSLAVAHRTSLQTRSATCRTCSVVAAACFYLLLVTSAETGGAAGTSIAAGWYSGEAGPYRWTFRASRRLPFGPFGLGEGQHRRTFIWLGSAAAAPQVAMEGLSGGKVRQPLPMPTAWATVGNVLYIGCRNVSCGSWCCGLDDSATRVGAEVVEALRQWQRAFPEYAAQPLYLAAHWQNGGQLIAPTVIAALSEGRKRGVDTWARDARPLDDLPQLQIVGVLVSQGSSPTAHFFSHSQLETGNGETHRSLRMARRDISCSEKMDAVKLVMNDAHFLYEPSSGPTSSASTVDYNLVSVSTFDRCYGSEPAEGQRGIDALERETESWSTGADFALLELTEGMSKRAAYRPSLPSDTPTRLFPPCASENNSRRGRMDQMSTVWDVVGQHNLRLLLLSDQAVDTTMHCSFYIGIFDADGLAWSSRQRSQLLHIARTNQTPQLDSHHANSSPIAATNLELELTGAAEGEVWVMGEGPIGTAFSSEHGHHGGDGVVSWVRLSPQKVCPRLRQTTIRVTTPTALTKVLQRCFVCFRGPGISGERSTGRDECSLGLGH